MSNQQFYTPAEIATILKISYEGSLSFIRNSGIKYIKVGRQYRVSERDFNEYISRSSLRYSRITTYNKRT